MENQESSTLKELAQVRAQARGQVTKEEPLPTGNQETETTVEPTVEAATTTVTTEVTEPKVEKEKVKIGDQEFDDVDSALKYAEKLTNEKLAADAYAQGIKDTLQSTQTAAAPAEPVEDNFDEEFYTNPKATLAKVKEAAKQELKQELDEEKSREKQWEAFFAKYPDLSGDRSLCEYVLRQNWDTLGKMTDIERGMQVLATKTREIFQGYTERNKPRTELPAKGGQQVSTGQSTVANVTPKKEVEKSTNFAAELKSMRKRS